MRCENDYCTYWEDGECILREIHINIMGMCDECILANIDKETLQKARENTRRDLGD